MIIYAKIKFVYSGSLSGQYNTAIKHNIQCKLLQDLFALTLSFHATKKYYTLYLEDITELMSFNQRGDQGSVVLMGLDHMTIFPIKP